MYEDMGKMTVKIWKKKGSKSYIYKRRIILREENAKMTMIKWKWNSYCGKPN